MSNKHDCTRIKKNLQADLLRILELKNEWSDDGTESLNIPLNKD